MKEAGIAQRRPFTPRREQATRADKVRQEGDVRIVLEIGETEGAQHVEPLARECAYGLGVDVHSLAR
jgi:hypothetical protein